jgi:hypothetical protein
MKKGPLPQRNTLTPQVPDGALARSIGKSGRQSPRAERESAFLVMAWPLTAGCSRVREPVVRKQIPHR